MLVQIKRTHHYNTQDFQYKLYIHTDLAYIVLIAKRTTVYV